MTSRGWRTVGRVDLETTRLGVFLAVRLSVLGEETLAFQVHLTGRAVETFRMPILRERFHPSIAGLNRELTTVALCLEQQRPIFRTIDFSIFVVEATGSNWLVTLTAQEAAHVESVLKRIYNFSDNG